MTTISEAPKNTLAILQKDITDDVNKKLAGLQKDGLVLPPNYSSANALKSAFFAMTNSANGNLLESCTKASIANALLDMTIQGLSPSKTQCYFIPYGKELKMTRSYFGTQAVLKRLSGIKDIWANVIYEGDKFAYENRNGRDYLVSHETVLQNRDNPIVGAYAVVVEESGDMPITVMTKKEIDASWSQGKTDRVHKKFPQEMAKRTVINRAAKAYVNTSDDSDILIGAINATTENEYDDRYDDRIDKTGAMEVEYEIQENANKVDFDPQNDQQQEPTDPKKESAGTVIDKSNGTINENTDGQSNWNL